MAIKTGRVEVRVSAEARRRIADAAQLSGESLSSFMVAASVDKAERVIAETAVTLVPSDYFDRLVAAIDRAERMPLLAEAAKRARKRPRIR